MSADRTSRRVWLSGARAAMVPFLFAYLWDVQPHLLWAAVVALVIVLNVIEGFRGLEIALEKDRGSSAH